MIENQDNQPDERFAEAVDQWVSDPASQGDAQKVQSMLAAMDAYEVPDAPADLVTNTLARIDQYEQDQRSAMQIESRRRLPAIGLSFAEIAVVAAMIVMGFSLALPMLTQTRSDARRLACETHLATAGAAFGHYASDFNGSMPRGSIVPGDAWWKVGDEPEQSNSAHLYRLARAGYIDPNTLACPENSHAPSGLTSQMQDWPEYDAVSYSYQNQYTAEPTRLSQHPMLAVLADKNPLFYVRQGKQLYHLAQQNPDQPSHAHQGQGQNILLASGSVQWSRRPIVRGDNIWLVSGIGQYTGNEVPTLPGDSFLVP